MAAQLTDDEIAALLAEPKALPSDYRARIQPKPKRGHKERELDVSGQHGNEFRLILRQADMNVLDFSVILAYRPAGNSQHFRLRRYNGKSHEHTNAIEEMTFYNFHIHTATERYQDRGMKEDSYAEPTDRYADFDGAITCMLDDCTFELPPDGQPSLF
jgi:hypothetical protein